MTDTVKIGDILYGGQYGRPEHWRSETVTGETPLSWLLGDPNFMRIKISKSGLLEAVPRYGHIRWFTISGKIEEDFIRAHRARIAHSIYHVKDAAVLRKIAELIGYEVADEPAK